MRDLQVVQTIHFPISARSFVSPIVEALNAYGIGSELWFQNFAGHERVATEMPVPHRLVDLDLCMDPLRIIKRVSAFRAQLRSLDVKVVHSHQMRASVIPLLAARQEGIPVRIYHNHGLPYLGHKMPLRMVLRMVERINMELATHVVLVSHSNRNAAVRDGLLNNSKSMVFGAGSAIGIDLRDFRKELFEPAAAASARQSFAVSDSAFVIGYVGRPVARKGFNRLLSVWRDGRFELLGGRLLLAGCSVNDCERAGFRSLPGVKALGYISDLKPFYAACDVITLPSDHEGFPYSLLEGGAAGRALHGSDIPGIQCAIQEGVTGLLFPSGDDLSLMESLKKLALDEDLRRRLGHNARKRVEVEFNREAIVKDVVKFYIEELGIVQH
jgi:glycosyltransferase involved in cell wall biosynthesis